MNQRSVSYPTPRPLLFHVHGSGFRCTRHVFLQRCHDMASPVGWGTGARTLGSGGNSMHFKVGLSPAPMATFPAAPLKFRTAGFPQYGFKFQAPLSSAESLPMSVDGLSVIPTYATFPHSWLSPSESPRPGGIPPQCAGLQRLTTPPGPRGPRSGEFFMASPSSLADLIRQSGFLRSISQQSRL